MDSDAAKLKSQAMKKEREEIRKLVKREGRIQAENARIEKEKREQAKEAIRKSANIPKQRSYKKRPSNKRSTSNHASKAEKKLDPRSVSPIVKKTKKSSKKKT